MCLGGVAIMSRPYKETQSTADFAGPSCNRHRADADGNRTSKEKLSSKWLLVGLLLLHPSCHVDSECGSRAQMQHTHSCEPTTCTLKLASTGPSYGTCGLDARAYHMRALQRKGPSTAKMAAPWTCRGCKPKPSGSRILTKTLPAVRCWARSLIPSNCRTEPPYDVGRGKARHARTQQSRPTPSREASAVSVVPEIDQNVHVVGLSAN